MRLVRYTIWAILTLTSLSASAGFEGFPLAASTNDTSRTWLTAQEAWMPVRQLIYAIQERCLAANITPFEYMETVTADGGIYSNEVGEATVLVASGFPREDVNATYAKVGENSYYNSATDLYIEEDWWSGTTHWLVSDALFSAIYESDAGPESSSWYVYGDPTNTISGSTVLTTIPAHVDYYREVATLAVTNKVGDFDVTRDGTSYTGVTYVTRDLLDAMWDQIGALAPHYCLPGDEDWNATGWVSWDLWFGKDQAFDYSIPAFTGVLSHYANDEHEKNSWRLQPYLLSATPALVYERLGMTNAYYDLQTNDWGIATSGSYYKHPLLDDTFDAKVVLAEAICKTNSSWQSHNLQSVPNREGVDLTHYLTVGSNSLAELVCTSTNGAAGVSADIAGTVAILLPTNTVTTNLAWNTAYDTTAELSSYVVTNTTYYLAETNATETLALSNQSEYVWLTITGFTVSPDASTNTSVALAWDVSEWNPISYRLYAEELDRMYYALKYMRYLLAVEGRDGQLVGGKLSTNVATYTSSSMTKYTEPEVESWMAAIMSTWTTNLPLSSARTLISSSFGGATYSVGEFDKGAAFDKYYYQGPATNASRKDFIGIKDDGALPPWHWPQTLEVGYYFPQNHGLPKGDTPPDGWPVIIGRTIDSRPPEKSAVADWLEQSLSDTYGANPVTNTTRLPFALCNKWVTGTDPYGKPIPPYDDVLTYSSDFEVYSYAGNGGKVLYTNGVPMQGTELANRPIHSTDAIYGWAGSSALAFDYGLSSTSKFSSARAYYGEFLEVAQADVSVVEWRDWEHPYTAVMTNDFAFTGGVLGFSYTAYLENIIFGIGEFRPTRWDTNKVRYVYADYIFEGNSLLSDTFLMESKDMAVASDAVSFDLGMETNAVPTSPGIPGTPAWDEVESNVKNARQRWAGCMVTEMFFILEWNFEYQ